MGNGDRSIVHLVVFVVMVFAILVSVGYGLCLKEDLDQLTVLYNETESILSRNVASIQDMRSELKRCDELLWKCDTDRDESQYAAQMYKADYDLLLADYRKLQKECGKPIPKEE